ncbi:tRNA (guanine-N(7)-)-methyltransferase [bioreactor metagenome]|uniref:tRNA (guanine(46)-N(7))-methyltransferase n=1 Tax=bioreactor metagenome TaxID=1076179 RepID=A0A645G2Y1_9ZZZZ
MFPDPWVKTKHKKRRVFNIDFLDDVYRILTKNGKLFLATDILEVHKDHLKILNKFEKMEFKEVKNDNEWNKPQTNKEVFCRKEGIEFYRIIAKK